MGGSRTQFSICNLRLNTFHVFNVFTPFTLLNKLPNYAKQLEYFEKTWYSSGNNEKEKEQYAMLKGVIQNDEYLVKAIQEDKTFAVKCNDEKDCNSKRVSLYNARRAMSLEEQRKVCIEKKQVDGDWFVFISKAKNNVFEVVDGRLVGIENKNPLRESSKTMIREMLEQGLPDELVIETLLTRDETPFSIKEEIEKLRREKEQE